MANEADETIDFVVTLGASASGEVTVGYATSDGTAVAVDDYEAASGTLTFAAGTVEQTISVSLTDDSLDELSETLDLTLSDPAGATIDDGAATGTIADDDPEPELRATGSLISNIYTLVEGEDLSISVRLSEPSGRTVTVDYETGPGTILTEGNDAEVGSDYTHVAGTLTFAPGEQFKAISVATSDDAVYEVTEGFAVRFSNPQGATLYQVGPRFMYVYVVMLDNEMAPSVTIEDAADVESAGELAFSVTLTGPIEASLTYSTADGTAVAGEDYTAATDAVLSFGPGVTSNTIRVAIDDDDAEESVTETFSVHLSLTPLGIGGGDLEATGTIRDDDGAARLTIGDASASEGDGSLSFTVTLAGQSSGSVTVEYATAAATATAGRDYTEASGTLTFAPGDIKKTITVALLDDDVHEGSETFSVSLSDADGAMLEDGTGTGTIVDDDESPLVTIHGSEGPENGHLDFVVTLSTSSEATVSMDYLTDTGIPAKPAPAFALADADSDFVHKEGTLNFAPGETSKTIRVRLLADTLSEAAEAVLVTMSNPVNVGFELREGSDECPWGGCNLEACCDCGIILDVTPDPTLAVADAEIAEDGGTLSFSATLSAESASDVTVSYATSDGTAVAGDDYEAASGVLTFAAGETEREIEVAVLDDSVEEPDESLTLTLSDPVNAVLGDAVAKGTILDDDEAPTAITLSAVPGRVLEDQGPTTVAVTATLDKSPRRQPTTVTVSVAGSGDPHAVDFDPVADFAITIPANAASVTGTFTLTPENDRSVEPNETLSVDGTSDLPVTGTTVELVDDDAASTRIVLSVVPSRMSEGAGPTPVAVTASLDRGFRQTATAVTISVAGSGDPNAVDFEPVSDFRITIEANRQRGTGTFTLTPRDDRDVETDEMLRVSGASDLPVSQATMVLADDDEVSTRILLFLSVSPAQASEGGGPVEVTVTAALDRGVRPETTRIAVAVDGSGDPFAVDFAAVPGLEIVIPANAPSGTGTFTVVPEDDAIVERDEVLTVSGVSDLPVSPATMELLDDDEASMRILLSAAPAGVREDGGPVAVTVTASLDRGLRQEATTVTVSVSGSGNPHAVDFAAVPDFTITIAANAASGTGTFTLRPEDDAEDEADETLTLSGVSDLPVSPATMELLDDDEASMRILLSADPARVSEGGGPVAVTVTAALDRGVRPETTRIAVAVDGSGDPFAVDFAPVPGLEIVIPANAPSGTGTFTVVPEDDAIVERDEVLTVSGVSDLPVSPATMELLDDDEASMRILLSADPARVSEGDGPVAVTVTASLDRGLRQEATNVTVSVTGGGDADAVDFDAVADFGITIEANAPNGTGTFTLTPENDAEDEADETLALTGESDLPVTSASVVLADDDEMTSRVLSIADAEAAEGAGEVRFAVTLDGPSPAEVTVSYATADPAGSVDPVAGAGIDYESASGTLTFAPGEVSRTIAVSVIDDDLDEPDEMFALVLSDLQGATLGRGSALGTIRDDDEPPALSIAGDTGSEDVGELVFSVTLMARAPTEVTVNYATMDDTAIAGDDYEPVEGTLTFAPGETAKTIRVAVVDDALYEADEEIFAVTLSGHSGATLAHALATGVIRDNDEPPALSVADAAGDEDVGALEFAVTLSAPSGIEVSVSYATADGTATAGGDYAAATGTLMFAPGEVSRTIAVSVIDDSLDEPDETFTLVLSDLQGAALGRGSALGTIRDDDEPPALSIAGDTGSEDVGELVFSVTLVARALTEVTVNYATMDDTAIAGDDYGPVEGTLTFAPGETARTIRVAVVDDAVDEADEEVFAVTLSGPSGATLAHALATGVIRDDDEPPALSVADAAGDEDVGALEFAVALSAPSGIEVSVSYATADGTAAAGGDYAAATGTLMFAPGEVSRTIAVSVIDDSLDEPDETFTLVLSDPRGATLGRGSALGTIRDDDEPPALSIAGDTGSEDVGELVFSVTLMARALTEVTVNYATMDDTAIAGDDYGPVEGTLTFAPGETARTIRVAVVDDAVDEADEESFAVTLSGHSGATLAHALATGVIRDDDEPPALSVADAAGDEDVGALEFAVKLSAPSGIEVSASYATADGTATAGGDYAAATGTLMFAPGEVSQTIRVAVLDDALHEADEETFSLALSELRNATAADDSATGTIRDNDLAPPSVAGDLPAALLCVGGAPYELDLADYFDGKELRFSAISSTPLVATAALAGSRLTVAPASEGESSVTVTASNDAGSASGSIGVRVVTDPAEIEAVESVLASIGRAVLTGVTESVRARFDSRRAVGKQGASTNVQRGRTQVVPGASAVLGNQWPSPAMHGTRSGGWDGSGFFEPQVSGDDWFETMNRTHRRGMVPFSFSLDSAQSGSTGPAWAVWGRAGAHRFESGIDGSSHDGTLTAVHLGADARVGDWLAGVSLARSAAQADYRFERSVDACGGGGVGDGMVDAELTSVHPYVGRQIGRGSVWATLGAGGGEVSVERCETGQRNEADLSMRLAALGGRHPFAGGERIEVSVVEEISVLDLTTGDAPGPVGDRSVTVGQARLGLEAAGVAPADCECSLTTFVRAFARGDWGDGATGAGLELAAGVRYRNHPRRLGIDAGARALAVHSAEDAKEHSANLTFSILPKADGTGWQASLAWRRGASDARLDTLGGTAPWIAPSAGLPGAKRHWIAQSRLGYGIRLPRGSATPFVELDAGHSGRGGARFGVRHEFGDRARGLVVEWGIEQSSLASAGNKIVLEALGRF